MKVMGMGMGNANILVHFPKHELKISL